MSKKHIMAIPIKIDEDYVMLIKRLSQHYRQSQLKAATQVNSEMLKFYWALGKVIVEMKAESKWGANFIKSLSADLRKALPGVKGLSETNIGYAKRFFLLYSQFNVFHPQFEGEKGGTENYPPNLGVTFIVMKSGVFLGDITNILLISFTSVRRRLFSL